MSESPPSAFQSARLEEVAKIIYDSLTKELRDAIAMSDRMLDEVKSESSKYQAALVMLLLVTGGASARAGNDLKRFGLYQ